MDALRIGYDGKRAVCNNTGLGNYSRLIVERLAKSYPDNQYLLYTPRLRHNPRLEPLLEMPNVEVRLPSSSGVGALWRVWGMSRQLEAERVDLYHGLSGELPLNIAKTSIPTVLTMHDVIFRRFPNYYKPIDRTIYDFKFRRSARAATRIIAISERTRDDLMEFYGVDGAKIDVIYQGCDPQFNPAAAGDVERWRRHYGLARPYIVTIGTVEHRKNQLLAVKALERLDPEVQLVIVGRATPYADEIKRYVARRGLDDRVVWISDAPFGALPALYAGALASTYTSRYEGFGIPVIESLSVGTPVVVATGSCLEEAGGPDTPAVDPDDCEELAHVLSRLIGDAEYRTRIRDAGLEYVKRFSADDFARQVMDVYRRVLI